MVDRALLDELIAEPTDDRYAVYADLLQTRDDPRGELIALDLHARRTGTPRDPHADELERRLFESLRDALGVTTGVKLTFERGFVFEVIVASNLVPEITSRGWLAHEALAMVRSFGVYDRSSRREDTQPYELLGQMPTLERVAIGSTAHEFMRAANLTTLFAALPKLRMLELRARSPLFEDAMVAVEQFDRLESLALWTPSNDQLLERVIEAKGWPRLTALALNGRGPQARELPSCLLPLLDGSRHPKLEQLALMSCGFEAPLITELVRRPLGKRLRALGLHWHHVDAGLLEEHRAAFERIELIWPRPVGITPNADDDYQLARRLRVGLDRDRLALPFAIRATELDPSNWFHWVERGYVHSALDQLPEKLAAMDRAIEINRERWGGWAGRGSALRDLNRFAEAQIAYESGILVDPRRASLHHGLGLVHERAGHLAEAIACFEAAAERSNDDDTRAWYLGSIAHVLLEHDQHDEAALRLRRARELAPTDARLARLAGFERLWSGATAEAHVIAMEIPNGPDPDDNLFTFALRAAALRETGHTNPAGSFYDRIVLGTDCPAWIAFAWFGATLLGESDAFSPLADVIDPLRLADAIATQVNTPHRMKPLIHDTVDRCDDRIHCAVAALGAAAAAGRLDEARARHAALAAYLAGPAPVKNVSWWLELGELLRLTAKRVPAAAELLATGYRLATGGG
jgi:uncharacterized protein (TIGR02996 family)